MSAFDDIYDLLLASLLQDVGEFLVRAGGTPTHDPSVCLAGRDVQDLALCPDCRDAFPRPGAIAAGRLAAEVFGDAWPGLADAIRRPRGGTRDDASSEVARTAEAARRMAMGNSSVRGNEPSPPPLLVSPFARLSSTGSLRPFAPAMLAEPGDVTLQREPARGWPDHAAVAAFKDDLARAAATQSRAGVTETVAAVLDKWLWAVPAAGRPGSAADVSLAVRARMSAAFAAAIWRHPRRTDVLRAVLDSNPTTTGETALALIGGDVSGIQRFIYGTTTSHAARSLRARSMYVQFIAEVASRRVTEELGLHPLSVLMASGGRFYILAPVDRLSRLGDVSGQLLAATRSAHGFELQVVLGGTAFSLDEAGAGMHAPRMGDVLARVSESLGEAKRHRLAAATPATLTALFSPGASSGTPPPCGACGADADFNPDADANERRCRFCHELEEFGRRLLSDSSRAIALTAPEHASEGLNRAFGQLGLAVSVGRPGDAARVVTLNSTAIPSAQPTSWGFTWSLASRGGQPADFAELASRASGRPMLGVFRCDVDGLGATLARGLGEDVSLARLATMSWLLDTFFAGRLGELVEWDARLYPVYGGGDDACVVGAWDAILDFALQVHEEFAAFTGSSRTSQRLPRIVPGI